MYANATTPDISHGCVGFGFRGNIAPTTGHNGGYEAVSEAYHESANPPPGPWNDPNLDEWHCDECASLRYVHKAHRVSKVQCPQCSPDAEGKLIYMHRLSSL